jgi:hypothetical protein
MTEGPKRDHAAVWQAFHQGLAPAFRRAGFVPHPAYAPGFDSVARAYEAVFLGRPAADGLRLIYLSYNPHEPAWQVIGQLFACSDARDRTTRLGSSAEDWTADLASQPSRRSDLLPNAGWAFWRGADRLITFKDHSGTAQGLSASLQSALRGWPEFVADLMRRAM